METELAEWRNSWSQFCLWHPLVPFKTAGAQGHCCWCPRKAKDAALGLWFGAVGREPVKSREVQAAAGSHPISPLNNTSLETLLVTSPWYRFIPTLFHQWNYQCFCCYHRLLPTVFLLVCPSYCLPYTVICTYLLSRDICNYNTISTVLWKKAHNKQDMSQGINKAELTTAMGLPSSLTTALAET